MNAQVAVGGATGVVKEYTDGHNGVVYTVAGVYTYTDGGDGLHNFSEPWSKTFHENAFLNTWNPNWRQYDLSKWEEGQATDLTYDWNGHFDMQVGFPDKSHNAMARMALTLNPLDWMHEAVCTGVRDRIMALSKELLRLKGQLGPPNADGSPRFDKDRPHALFHIETNSGLFTCGFKELDEMNDWEIAGTFRMLMRNDEPLRYRSVCRAAQYRIWFLEKEVRTLSLEQRDKAMQLIGGVS
jgi:hypothetical protein